MRPLLYALFIVLLTAGCKNDSKEENIFHENWGISPKEGAFRMDDWIVWGGSVIKAEDGKYYMYASRWQKLLSMSAWVTNSEIMVAVSDVPEGPYSFQKVVLLARGNDYWDGMMTHNPNIQYHDGKYISDEPKAYSRTITLNDGTTETIKKLERPQVLFENGHPTHFFFACRNEKDEIFNMVRPLK